MCVLPAVIGVATLTAWVHVVGTPLRVSGIALLAAWPALLALQLFWAVGVWRAAGIWSRGGGPTALALAARLVPAIVFIATLAWAAASLGARGSGYLQMAGGSDPAGTLRIAAAPDGRPLRLEGPVGVGDAARVEQALAQAPRTQLLEITSPGGRLDEAQQIAALVRDRKLPTRAVGPCVNACALVLRAGTHRQALPAALLGFHRESPGPFNAVFQPWADQRSAAVYRDAGLPANMVRKITATPRTLTWHPDFDELEASGLLSTPPWPLDTALPPREGAQPGDYAQALNTRPTWAKLEHRFPGLIASAGERMHAARTEGADDVATQIAAQRLVDGLVPRLLADAGPELHQQFAMLLVDQLAAASSTGAAADGVCRSLLGGESGARRQLPAALAQREAAWLVDAAAEPAPTAVRRATSAIEHEVLQRALSSRASTSLGGLWRPESTAAMARLPGCAAARALIAEALQLPAPERRLALRLTFASGRVWVR